MKLQIFAKNTHLSQQSRLGHLIGTEIFSNQKRFTPSENSWINKQFQEYQKF
jgi:hypothetical protein